MYWTAYGQNLLLITSKPLCHIIEEEVNTNRHLLPPFIFTDISVVTIAIILDTIKYINSLALIWLTNVFLTIQPRDVLILTQVY